MLAVVLAVAAGCSKSDTVEVVNSCASTLAVVVDNQVVVIPAAVSSSFEIYAPTPPTVLTAATTVTLSLQTVGSGRYRAEPTEDQCPAEPAGMMVVLDSVANGDKVSQVRVRVFATDVDLAAVAKSFATSVPDSSPRISIDAGELDFRFAGGQPKGIGRRSVPVDLTDAIDSVLHLTPGDRRVVDCTAYPCATRELRDDGSLAEPLVVRARTPGSLSDSAIFQTIVGLGVLSLLLALALTAMLMKRRRRRPVTDEPS